MNRVNGVTFAPFCGRGGFEQEQTYQSLDRMLEKTGANYVMLVPSALQDNPQSEHIDFTTMCTIGDEELVRMIDYLHAKQVAVGLKPTVNCKNGTWRAFISFFDEDVPCEPKWSGWFASYTAFQLYYAAIAEQTKCEMFFPGCEMVMTEHREEQWRKLIADIRGVYHGLVSYNTDKYQENHVKWWDCVDLITSSGYYPINQWEQELDRIEQIVRKYKKPFFFAETGCMSVNGSSKVPNNWMLQGEVNLQEQTDWYEDMFAAIRKRDWVGGTCLWSWTDRLYPEEKGRTMKGYDIYGKPALEVVRRYYTE